VAADAINRDGQRCVIGYSPDPMSRSRTSRPAGAGRPPPEAAPLPWGLRLWDDPASAPRPGGRRRRGAALALVVLATLATRLSPARTLDVDNDEAVYTAGVGLQYAEYLKAGDVRALLACRENHEHPPLVKLLHGVAIAAGGMDRTPAQAVFAARGVEVLLACLTAALLFTLSPWAALVFALHSWEVYYSSKGWLDSATVFFGVAAVVGFLRSRGRWGRAMAVSAVALGAGVASKYVTGVLALTLLPFLVLVFRRRPGFLLLYVGVSFLTFFALDPALWLDPAANLRASIGFHQVDAGGALYRRFLERYGGDPGALGQFVSLWGHQARYQAEKLPFALDRLFLVLGLLGLPLLLRRSAVAFAWFLGAALFLLLYPIKYPHYTLILLPPLALSAAEALRGGARWARARARSRWAGARAQGRWPRLGERLAALPRPAEPAAAALAAVAITAVALAFTYRHWGTRADTRAADNSFAYTLQQLGRVEEARAVFARSAQSGGELSVAAHLNLADLLLQQKKLAEARAELGQALRERPDSPEGHALLGNALLEEGKLDEALAEYQQVDVGRLPEPASRASLAVNVGSIRLRQRQLPQARAALEQALQLAPRNGEARYLLGLAAFLEGDPAGAEREIRRSIEDGVSGWKVHHDLGIACAQQKRYPEAIAAWEKALTFDPGNAETRKYIEDARRRVR
jgi:tetratricopeptide (TPR) repeat protein